MNRKSNLLVNVLTRKNNVKQWFEASVDIPNLTGRLCKVDGNHQFTTKSSLSYVAKNLAKKLGYSDITMKEKGESVSLVATIASKSKESSDRICQKTTTATTATTTTKKKCIK